MPTEKSGPIIPKLEVTWHSSDDIEEDRELAHTISMFAMETLKGRGGSVFGTLRPHEVEES